MITWRRWLIGGLVAAGALNVQVTAHGADSIGSPAPESPAKWHGYERLDFRVAERPCILVRPANAAPGRPWIWRTEFFGHQPQADVALLARGWHVAYMNAKDLYGAPPAIALFDAFYRELVKTHDLAPRVVLEGLSRGGLYAFNFAASYPERVAGLYLDAPVLDIRSWPRRLKDTPAGAKLWRDCLASYGITEEQLDSFRGSPLDRVAPVAAAQIPIIVVCGDADEVVPLAENTTVLERRYRELGGTIEVIVKRGGNHHPHSLEDPTPIVNFLTTRARF